MGGLGFRIQDSRFRVRAGRVLCPMSRATSCACFIVAFSCGPSWCQQIPPKLLSSVSGKKSHLDWSPGGDAIAFLTTDSEGTQLMVCPLTGGKPVALGAATSFAWSPVGNSVAIVRPGDGGGRISIRVWPEGKEAPVGSGEAPVFSKDERNVGFVRSGQAYVIPTEGGTEQKLTATSMIETRLAAARDGFFLTGNGCLWFAQPGATEKLVLRNAGMGTDAGGLEYYVNLTVSPDGSKIVLVSSGGQDAAGAPTTLILLNRDGTGKRVLGAGQQPCWSPDGKRFVFSSKGDLYNYSIESGTRQQLTNRRAANHSWPAWSPGGKHIAFVATLRDTNGDGKVDWRDDSSVFLMSAP